MYYKQVYVLFLLILNNPIFQPHNHGKKVSKFYYATPDLVQKAIDTSLEAKKEWEKIPMDERLKLFLNVADLMATTYRADLNATTMLGQAKTVIQVCILQASTPKPKNEKIINHIHYIVSFMIL